MNERPHALPDADEMGRIDALAAERGIDSFALMRAAGAAVAVAVLEELESRADTRGKRVTVCAGPGNNGGDGAVVAARLLVSGIDVVLVRVGGAPRDGSDAARAAAGWHGETLHLDAATHVLPAEIDARVGARLAASACVVDALLGAGLARDVDGAMAALVAAMARAREGGATVVSVDLPSGLDGNAHRVRGTAVRADRTVTFVRYKPAHLLYPGRELAGRSSVADIGIADAVVDAPDIRAFANEPALWRTVLGRPSAEGHKFDRGHVLVRGGAASKGGAARLSASACLACGAGLVTLACPGSATLVNAVRLTAVMLARADSAEDWSSLLEDERLGTLLIGPGNGVGDETRDIVERSLASGRDCVLDADALSSHREAPDTLLDALRRARGEVVITPHAGEFERVFGHTGIVGLGSKLHRARAAAERTGSVVLLKGADTVVAAPDGRASINVNAPPWLATAGAGDVLAGVVAALLAQGAKAFEAASAAVWLHGAAATALGYPMTAETLVPAVARTLHDLRPVPTPEVPAGLRSGV